MTIDIPSLVVAAGGAIVGKVRLQKIVYLLDQIGLDSGFSYEYHHYGPYSSGLAEQVEDDVIFKKLDIEPHRRVRDGVPYVMFHASRSGDGEPIDSRTSAKRIGELLPELNRELVTVLELAATMHWIAAVENRLDWQEELVRRKGAKTQDGRNERALELLKRLGLPPAAPDAETPAP